MQELTKRNLRAWSMLGQRGTVCGVALIEIMEEYQNSYTLTADLAHLSGLDRVQHMFPERFVNVGIAEQNMIGIAAGLAAERNVVFATTYATFLTMRCYEQIRHHMGYQHMNIKLIGSAAGVEMGMSGNTHYTYEDIAIMRAIPNITVVSPADPAEAYQIMHQAAATEGPMYIRLTGGMNQQIITKCEDGGIKIGKSKELQSGTDVAVIFAGNIAGTVQKAVELLEGEGISTSVIDMHTIKPLDTRQLESQMGKKIIVTVEEHSIIGGLGGAVSEYYAQFERHPKVVRIGVEDQFLHPAGKELLLETAGLTPQKNIQTDSKGIKQIIMVHLDYCNMQEYFRQTKEFIFLDKVDIEPGESAKGTKLMSSQDWYFQYHFPGNPVMPGVFQMEALMQTGGLIINTLEGKKEIPLLFGECKSVKIKREVRPGDILITDVTLISYKRGICWFKGVAAVEGKTSCQMEFSLISPTELLQMKKSEN